ncbi:MULTISPECIES: hypothetical protein [Achromobacter]|nr:MULTISPECIES: hypothetical protein [Achromobacter]
MQGEQLATTAIDPAQLRRIEVVHGSFLYQHLYGVACLLMSSSWGWNRMLVEFDEDIELQHPDRHIYVQVKTRVDVVRPGDVRTALDRFERYRQEHAAQRRTGDAEFILALNTAPSPELAASISSGQIPADVRVVWPGHDIEGFPPPWPDVDAAFAWCTERAETLPFLMVAPEVLVLKLAGAMQRIASGTGEFSSHAVSAIEVAGMLEQFVHQLHDFPAPPLNYRPQDDEPALITSAPVRLIVGFSGAGKTSWAAQAAMIDDQASAYLDVADLPSALVSAALARELAARWLGNEPTALQAVGRTGLSGTEALRGATSALVEHARTYTVVVDNAHRLDVDDARTIATSLQGIRLVLLAQPTGELGHLSTALAVAPETLNGWAPDTIAADAAAHNCRATMATVARLKQLTAGLPLYVRSAILVASAEYDSELGAFCDALDSQELTAVTAQHSILSRVFESLTTPSKQVLSSVSIADLPLSADEMVSIAGAAFGIERRGVTRTLRSLRAHGLLQAYGSQRSKVHDAMRPIALDYLAADAEAERRAKEALLGFLEVSIAENRMEKERFHLFVRMLVDLRRVAVLADLATEESFHEVGSFPMVWGVLEDATRDDSVTAKTRFECLDALLYYRQKHGPQEAVEPLLSEMEKLLASGLTNARARLVFLNKSLIHWAEQGNENRVNEVVHKARHMLPDDVRYHRVFAYHEALSLWKLKRFQRAQTILRALITEYLSELQLDPETLLSGIRPYLERAGEEGNYAGNCRHLADCYDVLARALEGLRQPPGNCRPMAIRLFELSGSWDSAARVGIDLVWQHIDARESVRARRLLEDGLLDLVTRHGLTDRVVYVRILYAHALGKTGDVDRARRELRAINPYLSSLSPAEQLDARVLTEFLL